jgi:glycosyltransferase involved in cell wall biosynthesis
MFSASVVITTKNRREELLKSIESAMGQRGLLEVIVIDDGSTDGTEAAVMEMLKKDLTTESTENTIERRGRCEMEQPKVGPKGEEAGASESKGEAGLTTDDTDGHGYSAGLRLTGQAGVAFSNPSPSELTQDSANTSLIRSADGPASLPATSHSPPVTTGLPVLRLIRHEVSAGYIVRRNEGARVARGDVIFSLDDDAVFSTPLVVEQTLRDFSHPRIGAVAVPYIEPHKANRQMQRAPTREDVWITASYIGTAHAVRRNVFLALGGYREHLVHQGEEGDFCIRMLAAKPPMVESGKRKAEILKTNLTTIEHRGRGEKEQPQVGPKGERVGTSESKDTESTTRRPGGRSVDCPRQPEGRDERERASQSQREPGPRLASQVGASESDSLASGLAASPISESLARSASGPAQPATSYPPPLTAPEVPGFFVRLGNSDTIIHNESPKRDYSRMDFYGRRNDVLFHWQNTPMPDVLWQLPMTIAGGLLCAYRVKRWRKMLEGIGAGFWAILGGVERRPLSITVAVVHKNLKLSPKRL